MFDFAKVMAGRTNAELIAVVTEPSKYQQEAVVAAQNELGKRNLSADTLQAATKAYTEDKAIKNEKANESLDGFFKILTMLLPGLFTIMMSGHLRTNGYDRKAKELVTWTLYGFAFYTVMAILLFSF